MVDSRKAARKKSPMTVGAPRPARKGTLRLTLLLGALVVVNIYIFFVRLPKVREKAALLGSGVGTASGSALRPPAPPAPASGSAAVTPPVANQIKRGTVEKGDSVGKLLKREGLPAADADEVIRALQPVLDFKSLRAGQAYAIERAPDGRVVSFELTVSKTERVRATRGSTGALEGAKATDQTRSEVDDVGGRVTGSLYASMKAAGEKPGLVEDFADVFAYDLDFYVDVHDGDSWKAVVEKTFKDQELIGYGKIVAAEWTGKAGHFRAFAWKGKWYDEQGRSLEKTLLKTPLKFSRISSGFDLHRMHPILHTERAHMGVDYAAPVGTPVWAAASGVVESAGPAGGAGNMVVLRHDNGLATYYMHLSKFAKGLHPGQRVTAKQVIAFVGATGLATGPHLHFGVKRNGEYVDPLKLAPERGPGVSKAQMPQFLADIAGVASRLDHAVAPAAASASVPAAPTVAHTN
jgi:murein DD-endopeptidase MepM/ murein hydrolase activator NlpD